MARIAGFRPISKERTQLHAAIEAGYLTFTDDGLGTVFQIDTTGSENRQNPGRLSQTLQLDRAAAIQLVSLLTRAFDL